MKRNIGFHYIILDSAGTLLSHAVLECPPDAAVWYVRLTDDDPHPYAEGERIHLVGMEDQAPSRSGYVLDRRDAVLRLNPADTLGEDMRRNLRIPVRFDSFIYPLTGHWTGRRSIVSYDLSCGGVAFSCLQRLEDGEVVEAVVPVTSQPLVLRTQILRRLDAGRPDERYAAKFVDLMHEEEIMVREAVFGLQLQGRRRA